VEGHHNHVAELHRILLDLIEGLWFRVECLVFRVWCLGFGVWGSGLRVKDSTIEA